MAAHLVDKYPQLTKNEAFMDKLPEGGAGARGLGREQPGLLVRDREGGAARAERERRGPALPEGLEGRKAGDTACADEVLELSVISALALRTDHDNAKIGRAVAAGACFDKLRPAIEAELEDGWSCYTDNVCSVLESKSAL